MNHNRELHIQEKLFIPLFRDAKMFLDLGKPLWEKIAGHNSSDEMIPRSIWHKEKAFARSSFINTMAGIEALCNALYRDFHVWDNKTLPANLTSKNYRAVKKKNFNINLRKKAVENWPLFEKVMFIVSLCTKETVNPINVFDNSSDQMLLLLEYVEIRNSIVHGKIVKRKMELMSGATQKMGHKKVFDVSDEFDDNEWPLSRFPRYAGIMNHECSLRANTHVQNIVDRVMSRLGNVVPEDYLTVVDGRDFRGGRLVGTFKLTSLEDA